jgi:hypothetical protein
MVVIAILALTIVATPSVSAQAQYVEVTPGYINLGMVTSVLVTAPAAGSYAVIVQQPNGTKASLSFAPTSAGQLLNATYGNSTLGFKGVVNQVGTYQVFLEQGSNVISSASFYATNKLLIELEMVTGGTCDFVSGIARGQTMFPHTFVTYASNGAPWTNTEKGASIKYLAPTGQWTTGIWDSFGHAWKINLKPNWNYTYVGPWIPKINASDAAGNVGKFTGSTYSISPAELSTQIAVLNATSGLPVTSLVNGQTVTIRATITYPKSIENAPGFVGTLNTTRGGFVAAEVGWGYYNMTSGTFGGPKKPGALLGDVPMTYFNGTWTGPFVSSSLPTLPAKASYLVVVSSRDSASPANTGFGMEVLSPASSATIRVQTVTTSIPTTATQTQTAIQTQTATQTIQTIPDAVYAALAILLVIGVLVGYIVRIPRRS